MATYYVNQAGDGLQDGSSLANAWSMADLNSAANWNATPASPGQVSPGDTVILNGTLTSVLTIPGSGLSGNIITIQFAAGAKFSSTNFPSTGVIAATARSYITIDGSADGIIENTDNGTAGTYTTQTGTVGVRLTNCTNLTVQNLSILNLYRRVGTTETTGGGSGVRCEATTGNSFSVIKVLNNIIDETAAGVALAYRPTESSDVEIANNTISNINDGITVGSTTDDCKIDDVRIHHNAIHSFSKWDELVDNTYHHDGVHVFNLGGSLGYASNVHSYANHIYGPFGAKGNSGIYYSGITPTGLIYNNLVVKLSGQGTVSGGFLLLKTYVNPTVRVYNNTLIGDGTGGRGLYLNGGDAANGTCDFRGNYATGCTFVSVSTQANWTLTSDYNHGYNLFVDAEYSASDTQTGGAKTIAQWQALAPGYDANSIYTDPLLDEDYKLTANSPGRGVAENLSAYFTVDFDGISRPAVDPWDMGAYQYLSIPAATPLRRLGRRVLSVLSF